MLLIYIFLFATQFRLRTKAKQAMEAAGFMSATQLPKVAGGEPGGRVCHKVEGESGIPSWLWNYNYPYKYTSPARSTEFNVKLVVAAAAARGCHKSPSRSPFFFRSCPYFIYIYRTHLAALAGMHAVVETGGLIPADATEHGGAIEFCKKQKRRTLKIFKSNKHKVNLQDITNLAH